MIIRRWKDDHDNESCGYYSDDHTLLSLKMKVVMKYYNENDNGDDQLQWKW